MERDAFLRIDEPTLLHYVVPENRYDVSTDVGGCLHFIRASVGLWKAISSFQMCEHELWLDLLIGSFSKAVQLVQKNAEGPSQNIDANIANWDFNLHITFWREFLTLKAFNREPFDWKSPRQRDPRSRYIYVACVVENTAVLLVDP